MVYRWFIVAANAAFSKKENIQDARKNDTLALIVEGGGTQQGVLLYRKLLIDSLHLSSSQRGVGKGGWGWKGGVPLCACVCAVCGVHT